MNHLGSNFLKVLPVIASLLTLSAAPAAAKSPFPFPFFGGPGGGAGPGNFGAGPGGFAHGGRGPGFNYPDSNDNDFLPGLVVGTVVGGAVASAGRSRQYYDNYSDEVEYAGPQPWSKGWFRYCKARYRSFDPDTGTYVSRNGKRRFCNAG